MDHFISFYRRHFNTIFTIIMLSLINYCYSKEYLKKKWAWIPTDSIWEKSKQRILFALEQSSDAVVYTIQEIIIAQEQWQERDRSHEKSCVESKMDKILLDYRL